MAEDRLITVAVHTYEKAVVLKSILENEGIEAVLQNINLVQPVVSSGVRVRIHEADLPKALRIIEASGLGDNGQKPSDAADNSASDTARPVLVPVDFSDHSDYACSVAFRYAADFGATVLLLHSYITPSITSGFQLGNTLNLNIDALTDDEVRISIEEKAHREMAAYVAKLRRRMNSGELPDVRFATQLVDEIPEDAIALTAKESQPRLIVMGTRGAGAKERDLVGSVTAEVLDTCRFPVLTIPENGPRLARDEKGQQVAFFCNYEQTDLIALDSLHSLFPDARFRITLVKVPSRKTPVDSHELSQGLLDYCTEHLPGYTFELSTLSLENVEEEFRSIISSGEFTLLALPNKKRNIFARLFNPALANRLLFQANIPMIVLPV